MRYYNENPQVALWKEKYDKLKEENERLKDEVAHLELEALNLSNQLSEYRQKRKEEDEDVKIRAKRFIVLFNSLPWYKKIFYKFKL